MRATGIVLFVTASALFSTTAVADNSMMMMKKGETIAVMPDGHMGHMSTMDTKMMGDAMKNAKPMSICTMMMMGEDGKVYVVNTKDAASMKMCEKSAM